MPLRKFQFSPDQSFDTAVGLGLIEGVDQFSTHGFSGAVLTVGLETDVTTIPEANLDLLTAPSNATVFFPNNDGEAMEISSSEAADTGNIQIFALGPGGSLLAPFVVALNGITPVAITGSDGELLSRINFMRNFSPAGYDGTITIRAAGAGNVFANMIEHHQQMSTCRYTIPSGKKGLLKTAVGSMRKQGGTDTALAILIHVKPFDFEKFYHPLGFGLQRGGATTVSLVNAYPEAIDGPFDVAVSANASASGAEAAARVAGLTIDV